MLNDDLEISEVSALTGLSTRVIRHYTAIGLISSTRSGPIGRGRLYSKSVVEDLYDVIAFRQLGYGLQEIGNLMERSLKEAVDFKLSRSSKPKSELIKDLNSKASEIKNLLKRYEENQDS